MRIRVKPKQLLFQLIVLACVAALFYEIASNVIDNLTQRKIASGFDFLGQTSGFAIIQTLIPYSEASSFARVFWVGLLNTGLVAVIGIMLASVLGLAIGLARLSNNFLLRHLAGIYVETMRNIPLLLHLFFWYFAILRPLPLPRGSLHFGHWVFLNNRGLYLPKFWLESGQNFIWISIAIAFAVWFSMRLKRTKLPSWMMGLGAGIFLLVLAAGFGGLQFAAELPALKGFNFQGGIKIIPELSALIFALSLYTAAYIAEIVRAGVNSVPKGQPEAAHAMGLSRWQTMRLVVIPQALRLIIPPLTNQYLNLTKNSSLAAAIAYPDLVSVFAGTALNQTGQAVEILLITLGVYLVLSLSISFCMNWYNAHWAMRGEGSHV